MNHPVQIERNEFDNVMHAVFNPKHGFVSLICRTIVPPQGKPRVEFLIKRRKIGEHEQETTERTERFGVAVASFNTTLSTFI